MERTRAFRFAGRDRTRRPGVTRAAVGLTLACLMIAGLAPPATAAPEFELRGTVVDQDGAPLASICVNTDAGSTPTGSAITDADGTYVVPIDAGSHTVRFTDCAATPTHVTQWWSGRTSPLDADPVTITDGDLTLGPVTMRTGVSVSGTVHHDGIGLADATVHVSAVDGSVSSGAITGPDGTYRTGPLPDGAYTVRFDGPAGSGLPVQFWKSAWTAATAHPLEIRASDDGTEHSSVDAWMVDGSAVEGSITDPSGSALGGICVAAFERVANSLGDRIGSTTSAADGSYRITGLPPVDAVMELSACNGSGHATEWYLDAGHPDQAQVLRLGPGAVLSGLDAQLARGGSITGTVTDDAGTPLARICVGAVAVDERDAGAKATVGTETGPDGTYHLAGLGAEPVLVRFQDCNGVGPHVGAWFHTDRPEGVATAAAATRLTVAEGDTRSGVDARLTRAGTLSGRVADRSGPLGEVCVQASDDRGVAASTRTEDDGEYRLELARSGSFRVQFVDCSDHPDHVGVWWGGDGTRGAAAALDVALGEDVHDVSVELADGPPGSVAGRVTNVRGEPMAGICVVAYLAFGPVHVAATAADGNFTVPDVGSGTWALGYLGCGEDDLELHVVDPAVPSIAYPAQWLGGAVLHVPGDDTGPDPIAQGAELVDVRAGAPLDADLCFGCDMVDAELVSSAGDVATFSFAAPELLDGAAAQARNAGSSQAEAQVEAQADPVALTYRATCSAPGAPTLTSAAVTSVDSPLGVAGLVAGSSYECTVRASVDGIVVASSVAMPVATAAAPPPGSAAEPSATNGSGRPPAALAFTGSSLVRWLAASLLLVAGGLLVAGLTPSRSPSLRRRRP